MLFRGRILGPKSRRVITLSLTLALSLSLLQGATYPAAAAAAEPVSLPFPRLGIWWPDADDQPAADRARYDWVEMQNAEADHIPELRALNPDIKLMAAANARGLLYDQYDYNSHINVDIRKASMKWVLTQVGSTLTANVDAVTTVIPVADVTKFRAGEALIMDEELAIIKTVGTSSLTVKRGVARPSAAHASGARIASAVSGWSNAVMFDLTSNCPLANVGYGPETWASFNARLGHDALHAADWDGLVVDSYTQSPSWMVTYGNCRSIDWYRNNTPVTDLTAFDTSWNSGMVAYGNALRAAVGPDAIVIVNYGVRNYAMNGNNFEGFPKSNTDLATWTKTIVGPYASVSKTSASYLEWVASSQQPNYSTIQVYEYDDSLPTNWQSGFVPNYQKMRYGLATALMGDGFYAYEISTYGHATLGLLWFDEYDNAGKQRGYLGQPTGAARSVGSNVWRRDYAGGIALVNPDTVAHTISLGGSFRKIKGTQAPTVNDGSLVTAVTLQPRDGIVLLREGTTVPPVTDPPTTPSDVTAPVSKLLAGSSAPQRWYAAPVTLTLQASDSGSGVEAVYLDRGAGTETQASGYSFSLSGEGDKAIKYWAKDKAGNVEAIHTANVGIDQTPPAVSSNAKTTPYLGTAVVSITAADGLSGAGAVEYQVDDGAVQSGKTVTLVPAAYPATYSLKFRASDGAGNWSAWSAPQTIQISEASHVPVYRFYNLRTSTHFYTASEAEKANVIANLSAVYRYEGVTYYVSQNPAEGIPVYRFYNSKYGVHFYTASEAEKNSLIANLSSVYNFEGVAYFGSATSAGAAPVYRFYNTKTHTHFYTASDAERDTVRAVLGRTYHYEGVAYSAWYR